MYAPHTVTVYNIVQEIDPTTLDEVEKVYTTILRGVMLQASKGVNVRESGLESALSYKGNGGMTCFVKGEFVSDDMTVVLSHDDCYNVTKVDAMDYGSPNMQHWEVGGA